MTKIRLSSACLLLTCLFIGEQAHAIGLYESPTNRLIFSGRLEAISTTGTDTDYDDHKPHNGGSRVRLLAQHNFAHGWTGVALSEWGFDPFFKGGKTNHFKRQQYVGLLNDRYGSVIYGKQYSLMYALVGVWTDQYWINGTAAQGSFNGTGKDSSFEGTGRPSRTLTYTNRFGDLTVGLMYQFHQSRRGHARVPQYRIENGERVFDYDKEVTTGDKRHHTLQAGLQWHFTDDLEIGAVYSHSNITRYENGHGHDKPVNAGLVGVSWSPGNWYISATAGEYHNMVNQGEFAGHREDDRTVVSKARGYEFVSMYDFKHVPAGDRIQVYGGLNWLEDKNTPARNVQYLAGAAWLFWNENLILAFEEAFDDSKDVEGHRPGHNRHKAFVRINF